MPDPEVPEDGVVTESPVGSVDDVPSGASLVRRYSHQVTEATAKLHDAMARMQAEGASLREIAEAAGLTHTGVRKILARRDLTPEEEKAGAERIEARRRR